MTSVYLDCIDYLYSSYCPPSFAIFDFNTFFSPCLDMVLKKLYYEVL